MARKIENPFRTNPPRTRPRTTMTQLRGSIRFSPSPRATEVSFILSNTELATATRADFDRFWNVWLSAPQLRSFRLEFAVSDGGPAAYDGINRFLEHFAFHVVASNEEIKPAVEFHLSNWTELDEKKMMTREVLEAPVELYNSQKQSGIQFITEDLFIDTPGRHQSH